MTTSLQKCRHLGLVVLKTVGLVHHQTGPVDGLECRLVDGHQLIRGEQHVKFNWCFSLQNRKQETVNISGYCCGGVQVQLETRAQSSILQLKRQLVIKMKRLLASYLINRRATVSYFYVQL